MRRIAIWLAVTAFSIGIASAAFAQGYALITLERPFQARNLAGLVVGHAGAPVRGVLVEECDASFTRILASTRTDKDGHFAFPKATSGSRHYLSLSKDGFNPMHVTVHIRHLAATEVRIHLSVAV